MIPVQIFDLIFFILCIQQFQGFLKITLSEVEEGLLVFATQEEPNGIGEAERASCSHNKASDVNNEVKVPHIQRRVYIHKFVNLLFNLVVFIFTEANRLLVL